MSQNLENTKQGLGSSRVAVQQWQEAHVGLSLLGVLLQVGDNEAQGRAEPGIRDKMSPQKAHLKYTPTTRWAFLEK